MHVGTHLGAVSSIHRAVESSETHQRPYETPCGALGSWGMNELTKQETLRVTDLQLILTPQGMALAVVASSGVCLPMGCCVGPQLP